jgi:pimeloyl-ACP methyl ester carboxylesterase
MQERRAKIKGLDISYKIIGDGKTPVVILHGWGVSSDKYVPTAEAILKRNDGFKFYIPDLPGFGKSEEPKESWRIDDYADFAKEFVRNVVRRETGFELVKNIIAGSIINNGQALKREEKKVVIIAHSFGGRIAIKYAGKYSDDIEKLILTGAAGIKHPPTQKQQVFFLLSKAGKRIFSLPILRKLERCARTALYKLAREKDYNNASPRMKEIMSNALNEDLTPYLCDITVPTLLIWGEEDNSTPLADGKLMHQKIPDSKLSVIRQANHSAIYYKAEEFAEAFFGKL